MEESSDPSGFDADGICSYCRAYAERTRTTDASRFSFDEVIGAIKAAGAGNPHDCIIGLSGGVDSSYLAYLAVENGLRPLAVHLDNGWNSELAVNNIHQVVRHLGIDLHTHVVDWPEFRALQLAYIRSGVVDIEVVSDHAINAIAYRSALDEGIKFILGGNNVATEFVMPAHWNYRKQDLRNLKAIAQRNGGARIKTFPTGSTIQFAWWEMARGIRKVHLLDYVDYDKSAAVEVLQQIGWRPYPGKHYESLFTQFYQAHILPTKYGIDKRRAHLSSLVVSSQLTRDEALAELATPLYEPQLLAEHRSYVLKKLGMSDDEFDSILQAEPVAHTSYPHDGWYAFYVIKAMRLALAPLVRMRQRRFQSTLSARTERSASVR
jgi:N-acetyl sugar amidotransferase